MEATGRTERVRRGALQRSSTDLAHSLARRPAISTHRAVSIITRLFFGGGGSLVLLTTFLPTASTDRQTLVVRALDVTCVLLSIGLALMPARLPPWFHSVVILLGIGAIAVAVSVSGGGSTGIAYACLFLLPPFYAFFVHCPLVASAHLVVTVVASAVSMEGLPGIGVGEKVVFVGSLSMISVVVGWLVRAADEVEVDALTGLPNRRGAERLLEASIAASTASRTPAIGLLDLDHFKALNDTDGHGAGDELLVATSRRWSRAMPPGSALARYGGDEFLLVVDSAETTSLGELTRTLQELLPGGGTCSVGTAQWEAGESRSMLVARADVALYAAKRGGRGRVQHHRGLGAGTKRIKEGLRQGEFRVHFQPVVDLATQQPVGAEALVRWIHPDRGLVPPNDFLAEAEHDGAIVALGAWVLHEACRQAAGWAPGASGAPLTLAVNASGRELQDPRYAETVATALSASGLPPSRLTIELVESEYDIESLYVANNLHRLAALGVRTAIDDFGTGYSSLDRLRRLGVDVLKIDRSFIKDIDGLDDEVPLVRAMLAIARAMGLAVVAEGIETDVQAEWLRREGCQLGQGYLFGKAVPEGPDALRTPARGHRVTTS